MLLSFILFSTPVVSRAATMPEAVSGVAVPSNSGTGAWERLTQTLPGAWATTTKNRSFAVVYKLISNGSALVEEWDSGGTHETETVFHRDHSDFLLTHYCAQGNQPRLRVIDFTKDSVTFRFLDVTNRLADQAMLVERTLKFATNAFDDIETYELPDGKRDVTTYHFSRRAGQ